ncbi:MAG: dehydratase, partial [Acidobacteriota bacterium]|nr:dehydratase [Acidobacteriota bacterium]
MAKFFEDYELNDTVISRTRTITEADIVNFAGLSGDFHELHMSEEFARNGPFGRRIAHGALIFSIST